MCLCVCVFKRVRKKNKFVYRKILFELIFERRNIYLWLLSVNRSLIKDLIKNRVDLNKRSTDERALTLSLLI